jgi:glycosyltransferase involved in cell wall biosynthesis
VNHQPAHHKLDVSVIYDISLLGMGYLNPRCKTGLYRVTEQLLLALLEQPSLQLNVTGLNGLSSIWEDISALKYAQEQPGLDKRLSLAWKSNLHLGPLYQTAVELQRNLIHQFYRANPLAYTAAIGLQVPFKLFSKLDIQPNLEPATFNVYHSPYFALPDRALLGKAARVLTIHDMIPVLFPQFFTPKIVQKFKRNLASLEPDRDWVLCNSNHTKQDFCAYSGMDSDRVFVTPLAAAKHFHPINDPATIAPILQRYAVAQPYLLSLATLEPRKNLSFLIRSFLRLLETHPDWDLNLVLVGVCGWKNADIFQVVQQNPTLQSRVIFTGYVPDRDLSALLSGALAFVYPSFYEGFGLPPLEAMQCGTPVITSNTSSLPEVVGAAGLLIDPTQEDELCQAIWTLVTDATTRSQLAQQAIERASQFSWERCAAQTVDVYQMAAQHSE